MLRAILVRRTMRDLEGNCHTEYSTLDFEAPELERKLGFAPNPYNAPGYEKTELVGLEILPTETKEGE